MSTTPTMIVPPVGQWTLLNGWQVIASQLPSTPMVHLHLALPAHLASHDDLAIVDVLTATWAESPAARLVERRGGSVGVSRRREWLILTLVVLAEDLAEGLRQLTAMISDPVSEDLLDIAVVRARQQAQLVRAQPAVSSAELLWSTIFSSVPSALRTAPDPGRIATVRMADIDRARSGLLRSPRAHLVIVGDCQLGAIEQAVDQVLGQLPADGNPFAVEGQAPEPVAAIRPVSTARLLGPSLPATHVRIAAESSPVWDPVGFARASVASLIAGGNFSSRFNTVVRERAGLAYRTMAQLTDIGDRVFLVAEADVTVGRTAQASEHLARILEDLATNGPTPAELAAAVGYTWGSHQLALGSQAGRASCLLSYLTMGLGVEALRLLPQRLLEMRPEHLLATYAGWHPAACWVAVHGPDLDLGEGFSHV